MGPQMPQPTHITGEPLHMQPTVVQALSLFPLKDWMRFTETVLGKGHRTSFMVCLLCTRCSVKPGTQHPRGASGQVGERVRQCEVLL